MISFLKENSYYIVKMFVNQLGLTMFGTLLASATLRHPNWLLGTSIFSIVFYLFILYTVGWEIGAKDRIRVDGGRMKFSPAKGFLIALCANSINLLLALLMGLGILLGNEFGANMTLICNAVARLIEGMYLGLIVTLENSLFSNVVIEQIWWWFIVITLPAIIVGGVSYLMGMAEIKILPVSKKNKKN